MSVQSAYSLPARSHLVTLILVMDAFFLLMINEDQLPDLMAYTHKIRVYVLVSFYIRHKIFWPEYFVLKYFGLYTCMYMCYNRPHSELAEGKATKVSSMMH
uniref:Uncharacterized protein n=1 Tax=Micrurus carvalhoi TaxID=3147026 RepID=A0A2H6MU95_9SAUR